MPSCYHRRLIPIQPFLHLLLVECAERYHPHLRRHRRTIHPVVTHPPHYGEDHAAQGQGGRKTQRRYVGVGAINRGGVGGYNPPPPPPRPNRALRSPAPRRWPYAALSSPSRPWCSRSRLWPPAPQHIHRPILGGQHERDVASRFRRVDVHPRRLIKGHRPLE